MCQKVGVQVHRQGGFYVARKPPFWQERGEADSQIYNLVYAHAYTRIVAQRDAHLRKETLIYALM